MPFAVSIDVPALSLNSPARSACAPSGCLDAPALAGDDNAGDGSARERDDRRNIEDETDAPVTEDGAARQARHRAERLAKRLRDDLLLAEQLIDQQRDAVGSVADDHEQRVSRDLLCAIDLKDAVQPNHRDGLTPQHDHLGSAADGRDRATLRPEAELD